MEYYEELLGKKERHRVKAFDGFLKNGNFLTTLQQLEMVRPYSTKEVKQAMFSIEVNKSPGLDGYSSGFLRDAWSVVGEDVTQAILQFLESGKLLKQRNATTITLIPKIATPEFASQFRPISCCNVLYKCTSKMLCARLKKMLPSLITETQAAFVEGRSLIHNVPICHDLLRHYNSPKMPHED